MKKAPSLLTDSLFLTGFFAIAVTVMLGLFSFILSYWAMREFARASGAVVTGLDIIWPLTVDFAMIVFGLVALFETMRGQRAIVQRLLVILFSALSILFNVLHSPNLWSSQLAASMPPFSLVLALESLLGMITSIVKKSEDRVAAWRDAVRDRDEIIEALKSQIAKSAVEQAVASSCFCGYSGDDMEGHTKLHVFQVRRYQNPQQALDWLRETYQSSDGRLPTLEKIGEWQNG